MGLRAGVAVAVPLAEIDGHRQGLQLERGIFVVSALLMGLGGWSTVSLPEISAVLGVPMRPEGGFLGARCVAVRDFRCSALLVRMEGDFTGFPTSISSFRCFNETSGWFYELSQRCRELKIFVPTSECLGLRSGGYNAAIKGWEFQNARIAEGFSLFATSDGIQSGGVAE